MHPIIAERLPRLRELCRLYHVAKLDLFGSAASEQFNANCSDLDFVVDFLPVPAAMTMDTYFGFKEALEHLFERDVDLVERAAVRNPYFQEELDETKVPVYAAQCTQVVGGYPGRRGLHPGIHARFRRS